MNTHPQPPARPVARAIAALLACACVGAAASEHPAATAPAHAPPVAAPAAAAATPASPATRAASAAGSPEDAAAKIRQALRNPKSVSGTIQLRVSSTAPERHAAATPARAHAAESGAPHAASRQYIQAKAAALAGHDTPSAAGHDPHWAYEGANGPLQWGALKPEFNLCAIGKRQSPIHIEESSTQSGPAEPLQLRYRPSGGSLVNNGHTIQVDLDGDNTLVVRGSTYRLVQFHFHHPAEEKVNYKGFAMVAHLVHRNDAGQLAVVAVLLDPGAANALVNKVWTHMPLDSADRVTLPAGLLDVSELLPTDTRYYQFIGSLTTPPCTEGVLWLVIKQPMTVGREQLKLFSTLFPNNARPSQALNGRLVREAQ